MKTAILNIGNELLSGQTVNTNASWLGKELAEIGISVSRILVVADEEEELVSAFKSMLKYDYVLVTGGLGPTSDDRTKETVCRYFDDKLVENHDVLEHIKFFFQRRGLMFSERNRQQAFVPSRAKVLFNNAGTAPGLIMKKEKTSFVFMPGVPYEMQTIYNVHLKDLFISEYNLNRIFIKEAIIAGIGESHLADKLIDWENSIPDELQLAYLPSPGLVKLRLSGQESNEMNVIQLAEQKLLELKEIIPDHIFNLEGFMPHEWVPKLLIDKSLNIALAESCTGGYLSHLFTATQGSSAWFRGSIVAYQNDIKLSQLKLDNNVIEENGAVSREVVEQMAQNVSEILDSDLGVGISGIAGPDGGTDEKPVGTVWIAVYYNGKTVSEKFQFGKIRSRNIERSANAALFLCAKVLRTK
jgi:nicotinamide-nucleotide amidase